MGLLFGLVECSIHHENPEIACEKHRMRSRLKRLFWRAMDQVMPEGPPILLSWLVVVLLLINAFVALSRW